VSAFRIVRPARSFCLSAALLRGTWG
jgi:hypothetical protein